MENFELIAMVGSLESSFSDASYSSSMTDESSTSSFLFTGVADFDRVASEKIAARYGISIK